MPDKPGLFCVHFVGNQTTSFLSTSKTAAASDQSFRKGLFEKAPQEGGWKLLLRDQEFQPVVDLDCNSGPLECPLWVRFVMNIKW